MGRHREIILQKIPPKTVESVGMIDAKTSLGSFKISGVITILALLLGFVLLLTIIFKKPLSRKISGWHSKRRRR